MDTCISNINNKNIIDKKIILQIINFKMKQTKKMKKKIIKTLTLKVEIIKILKTINIYINYSKFL